VCLRVSPAKGEDKVSPYGKLLFSQSGGSAPPEKINEKQE
jgi:hypothetical protein